MTACGWEVLGCDTCPAYTTMSQEVQAEVEAWAVDRLWEWTNQRFGPCPITVHSEDPRCCWLGSNAYPRCAKNEVRIPAPAAELLEVIINGVEVSLEDFHIDDYSIVVRDGGSFGGNWEMTYMYGEPVPPGGSLVAGILACEYAKSICNDSSCRLPRRVSSIQRQGVVIGILDNFTNLKDGFTGIFEIDDWIMSATKPNRRSVATSPDVRSPRIKTWTYEDS